MSKLLAGGDSHDKIRISQQHTPEFREKILKLAALIGVAVAACKLGLYESQPYNWRSKQQQLLTSSEWDEELAILQKAATYFAKRLKCSMSLFKNIRLNSALKRCVACCVPSAVAGMCGLPGII